MLSNGAGNVLRKCMPNAFDNMTNNNMLSIKSNGVVGGVMLRPMSLDIKDLFSNKFKNLIS